MFISFSTTMVLHKTATIKRWLLKRLALSTSLHADECFLAQSRRTLVCAFNRTATASWRLS